MSNTLAKLSAEDRAKLTQMLTPKMTKYSPHYPTPKQAAFLLLDCKEAFYGGAAGGGKSDALLMAALQYVDVPGYAAILFRKSYTDLTLPGALMDRAATWLQPYVDQKLIHWNDKTKTYTFFIKDPDGNALGTSTLTFGFLDSPTDKYKYQGAEFQFIGFDEVTQLAEHNYRYLFSRLRKLKGVPIPLRVRGASNPGGIGHEWVKRRFIVEGPAKGRVFIPANMHDNPHLDVEEYTASLAELDPITRAQLQNGDWEVKTEGSMFDRTWFKYVDDIPRGAKYVRFWDLAATEEKLGKDPDWTSGCALAEKNGLYYLVNVTRFRLRPKETEERIKVAAMLDGYKYQIRIEQEPGSGGVYVIDNYTRKVLKGYPVKGIRSTGAKVLRAGPVSAALEQGRVFIVRSENMAWLGDFFDELEVFPFGEHDDQVDCFSGAFKELKALDNIFIVPDDLEKEDGSYWREA